MSSLLDTEEEEIERLLIGTWRLPLTEDYLVKIALGGVGTFKYTIAAASSKERARRLLLGEEIGGDWHIRRRRKPVGGLRQSSAGSVEFITSSIAPPHQRGGSSSKDELGPFLVLNFTQVPKSILNLPIAGFHIELGSWLTHIRQVFVDDYIKLLDLTKSELKVHGHSGIEVWRRIQ